MLTPQTYRQLVIALFVSFVAIFGADFVLDTSTGGYIEEAVSRTIERRAAAADVHALVYLVAATPLVWVMGIVGLFLFRPWGVWLCIGAQSIQCLGLIYIGFDVQPGVVEVLEQANAMLFGLVLAATWFTDVRERFHDVQP